MTMRVLLGSPAHIAVLSLLCFAGASGCGTAAPPELTNDKGRAEEPEAAAVEGIPPVIATVEGHFDESGLRISARSLEGKDIPIEVVTDPDGLETATLDQALLDTPTDRTYAPGQTGSTPETVALEQQSNTLSVYDNGIQRALTPLIPWTVAGCGGRPRAGVSPASGTCTRIRMRNLFTTKMLTHAYMELTSLTALAPTTRVFVPPYNTGYTETGSPAADAYLGMSAVPARWRFGSLEANTALGAGVSLWTTWVGDTPAGTSFNFHFQGVVRANVVDPPLAADLGSNGSAGRSSVSGDGRYVAFASQATNLVAGTVNPVWRIYRSDLSTSTVTLISTGPDLVTPESCNSINPSISNDGMNVAFESTCALTSLDTNTVSDVYVRRLGTSDTVLASRSSTNTAPTYLSGAQGSLHPRITANGLWVAFASDAQNLVPDRPANRTILDIYRRSTDPTLHSYIAPITRTKYSPSTWTNSHSDWPAIANLGVYSWVVYESDATNLVTGDTNGVRDVFTDFRGAGIGTTANPISITRISMVGLNTPAQLSVASREGFVSADGGLMGYTSAGAAFCTNTANAGTCVATGGNTQVYVRTLAYAKSTNLLSNAYNSTTVAGNGNSSGGHVVGPAGRIVSFISYATNLVPVSATTPQVFVMDRGAVQERIYRRNFAASHDANFAFPAHGALSNVELSEDGRYFVYTSNGAVVSGASGTRVYRTPVTDRKSQ